MVVVSAMGDTTDDLIALSKQLTNNPTAREMDMLLATGEQQSIALLAMTLIEMGYDAVSLNWLAGRILYRRRLQQSQDQQHRSAKGYRKSWIKARSL